MDGSTFRTCFDPSSRIPDHDLPTGFEARFIAAGIDPNHGDNGRWIQKRAHDSWSNLKRFDGVGPFNKVWREFFDANQNPTAAQNFSLRDQIRSASEIFDLLQRIRSGEIFEISDLDNVVHQLNFQ